MRHHLHRPRTALGEASPSRDLSQVAAAVSQQGAATEQCMELQMVCKDWPPGPGIALGPDNPKASKTEAVDQINQQIELAEGSPPQVDGTLH